VFGGLVAWCALFFVLTLHGMTSVLRTMAAANHATKVLATPLPGVGSNQHP
jgi:hypothetical protein